MDRVITELEGELQLNDDSMETDGGSLSYCTNTAAMEIPEMQRQLVLSQKLDKLFITMDDFDAAIPKVQPSAKREG